MAAKRSKYDSYDDESKGRLQKVFKPLLIALANRYWNLPALSGI